MELICTQYSRCEVIPNRTTRSLLEAERRGCVSDGQLNGWGSRTGRPRLRSGGQGRPCDGDMIGTDP